MSGERLKDSTLVAVGDGLERQLPHHELSDFGRCGMRTIRLAEFSTYEGVFVNIGKCLQRDILEMKSFSVAAVVKPPLYMFFSAIPDAVTPGHNGSGTFLWCGDPAQSDLSTYITSFLNSPSPGSSSQ